MPDFHRVLDLPSLLHKKSFFLLGPRATGKSYLIRTQLGSRALVIDLLRSDLLPAARGQSRDAGSDDRRPARTGSLGGDRRGPEASRTPRRSAPAHRDPAPSVSPDGQQRSQAPKGQANLLAGRAWTARLHPLAFPEIPRFSLSRHLRWGGLPPVVASEEPLEELRAYVRTYLYEEIQAEGLVRRLPPFSRFLTMAALTNGRMLNFAQIASDAEVPAATVREYYSEYYSLLEDTLVGFLLPAWTKSVRRKAISTARFFFFDTGVTHALAGTEALDRNSDLYGRSFEQWIGMELRAYLDYRRRDDGLAYWRSVHQHEVDFVVGDHTAVEAKATRKIAPRDLHGLQALAEEGVVRRLLCVSEDPVEARHGKIRCLPWQTFVQELWQDRLLT